MHTFMLTICFHIEFHRMATVINCCEFKNFKILKGDYCNVYVTILYVNSNPLRLRTDAFCEK